MAMKVSEVHDRASKAMARLRGAKAVSEQEAVMNELSKLADDHAEISIPGVGGPSLKAKKNHLFAVKVELERMEAKAKGSSPALGGRIRELMSTRDYLVRSIRAEEARIFDAIDGVTG